jgi:hypothetical protein
MRGILAVLVSGCGATLGGSVGPGDDSPMPDAPADRGDAPVALGPWGPPQKITPAADGGANEDDGSLSYSGLELVFAVVNTADANRKDLFYTSRPDLGSPFGPAIKLPFSIDGSSEETPRFSADDLTLFFAMTDPGGTTGLDIYRVTRPDPGSTSWSAPTVVGGVNSAGTDKWFMPCGGNRYLMIVGADIAEGVLGSGAPAMVPELSSASGETGTFLTEDCLTAYFASSRPDGVTNRIYRSTRPDLATPWSTPAVVVDFAGLGGDQQDPFLASDDRTFVFVSNVDGTNDVYISTR